MNSIRKKLYQYFRHATKKKSVKLGGKSTGTSSCFYVVFVWGSSAGDNSYLEDRRAVERSVESLQVSQHAVDPTRIGGPPSLDHRSIPSSYKENIPQEIDDRMTDRFADVLRKLSISRHSHSETSSTSATRSKQELPIA